MGAEENPVYAKTGLGLVQWRPNLVAGQIRLSSTTIDLGVPDMSVEEAIKNKVKSLVIGVAPVGGGIPDSWWQVIAAAAKAGLDIVNGLHFRMELNPDLVKIANTSGTKLVDLRVPPTKISVGTGIMRSGKRLLTVGTDCASGKKYTALALEQEMKAKGINATFRATGQTGIMIAGEGIPIDAVVGDFLSGAAEMVSPNNTEDHWDLIEGQGSLLHPGYSGVSLGLLHGSQPDAFVVCHQANRKEVVGWEHYPVPSIQEIIDMHLAIGKRTNSNIRCVGISINTSNLPSTQREVYLKNIANTLGLPCVDPLIDGVEEIVDNLMR